MGRAPCCDKANVKRGPWSPEEDSKLKDYIEKHGTGGNWIALPQKAGLKRCGKSCRLRWLNYLRPNIKHGEFTEDEDRIICSLYVNIGSRWSIIAAQLPGRTDNDIKNYWNTKLKKKLMALLPQSHHQKIITPSQFPLSSNLNQNQNQTPVQHYSPSSSSSPMYIDYFGSYNNNYYTPESTTTTISSFTTTSLDQIISSLPQSDDHYGIASTISSSEPFYQNQDQSIIMASGGVNSNYNNNNNNNMQYNYYYNHNPIISRESSMFMFGSEGSCSTNSSDGSCSHGREIINQEEIGGYNNMTSTFDEQNNNNYKKLMLGYNSIINDFAQSQTQVVPPPTTLDYDLEDIKQLISVVSDEIKGENDDDEEKKALYYCYY